jgi:hypothetical protein
MNINSETIEKILNEDSIRYLFLVSLISSDTNITKQDCEENLEILNYLNDNINSFNLSDSIIKEVKKYVKEGIEILNNDLCNITKG